MDNFFDDYFSEKKKKNKKEKAAEKPKILDALYVVPKRDKGVNAPKFNVPEPGIVHQADLLFLPTDNGYKYALVVVDANNSITEAEPIKGKTAKEVKEAFIKIYGRGTLKMPKFMQVDSGTEFKGDVAQYFKDNGADIRVAKVGRHRQQGMVERRNQIIGKVLFKRMYAQELLTNEQSTEWVDYLSSLIKHMNKKTVSNAAKKKPISDDPICSGDACKLLDKGTKVRVQLEQPYDFSTGKTLPGKFRSTDLRWDLRVRTIKEIIIKPGSPPLYLLDGDVGKRKTEPVAYTKNQLQVIPKDEQMPSAELIHKSKKKDVVKAILSKQKIKNKWYYEILWESGDKTFEPIKNMREDVPAIVEEFEKTL